MKSFRRISERPLQESIDSRIRKAKPVNLGEFSAQEIQVMEQMYFVEGASPREIASKLQDRTPQSISRKLSRLGWPKQRRALRENQISDLNKEQAIASQSEYARVESGQAFLDKVAEDCKEIGERVMKTAREAAELGVDGVARAHEAIKTAERCVRLYYIASGLDPKNASTNGLPSIGYDGDPEDIVGEAPPSQTEMPGVFMIAEIEDVQQ